MAAAMASLAWHELQASGESHTVASPHNMSLADTPSARPNRFVSVLAMSDCFFRLALTAALQPGTPTHIHTLR